MTKTKYLAIALAVLVAGVALGLGGYWWKMESQRRKEAAQRAQRRAKNLGEGLRALQSREGLEEAAAVREALADPARADKVRHEIPAWESYRERLAQCSALQEGMARAAAERRQKDIGTAAAQGFILSSRLFVEVTGAARKALDEMTSLVLQKGEWSDRQLARADRMRWRSGFYNALLTFLVSYVEDFSQTLRLLALNSATPAGRLAVFHLAAGAFASSDPTGGAKKLEHLLRQVYTEEEDSPTKARMSEALVRLKVPLALEPKQEEKGKK